MSNVDKRDVLMALIDLLTVAQNQARQGDVDAFNRTASAVEERIALGVLTPELTSVMPGAMSRLAELAAAVRGTYDALNEVEIRAATGTLLPEHLRAVKVQMSRAMTLFADDDFERSVIAKVTRAMETAREASGGKATPDPHPMRRRSAARYSSPALTVCLDGRAYQTLDWSSRGLRMRMPAAGRRLKPGETVRLRVSCDGVDGGGIVEGRVVRTGRDVGVSFAKPSAAVMLIKHRLGAAGVELRPA